MAPMEKLKKVFNLSIITTAVCKIESQFLVPRYGFRGRPIQWRPLHLPPSPPLRPTVVAMATKFYDKIGFNSAWRRYIFEIVGGFRGRAFE